MTAPRNYISLKTRLAAALCALTDDGGERLIPHNHAKQMHEDQVISLFNFDHYPIRHEAGGPASHWNLDPRLIQAHRHKTATKDIPQRAKVRRVSRSQEEFRRKMLAKSGVEADEPETKRGRSQFASRGFGKQHQPLRSRNNLRKKSS